VRNKTYFISDMHLGAGYISDPCSHERRIVAFLNHIANDAEALYMLGDVMDYWFEYRTVAPRGFVRFFGALASLADSGVKIYWFKGNHDIWLFDYIKSEIGLTVIDGPVVTEISGKTFFLDHGDGVGERPRSFRMLRSIFRNKVCQKLYSGIHPRWTVGFARAWSSHSRKSGSAHQPDEVAIAEPLVRFSENYVQNSSNGHIDFFIYGHLHIAFEHILNSGARMIILGDWINKMSYCVWDGKELNLLHFD